MTRCSSLPSPSPGIYFGNIFLEGKADSLLVSSAVALQDGLLLDAASDRRQWESQYFSTAF